MASYIEFNIETDPNTLLQAAIDFIQDRIPAWDPAQAALSNMILEACSNMSADVRDIAAIMPKAAFAAYGYKMLNVAPIDSAQASVDSTWTMRDDAGYTILSGTLVSIDIDGSNQAAFETVDTVTVPAGSTATAAGEVQLRAVIAGAAATDLGAAGSEITLIDSLSFIDSITLVGPTSGGVDAETFDDYVDRLSEELRLLTPRPILPPDFAILAKRVPGVGRATAIDLYNPAAPGTPTARYVTVAVIDEFANNVSGTIKTAVQDYLESLRESNFVVPVIDPTRTVIDVNVVGIAKAGWDAAEVEARVETAITNFLDPITWGTEAGVGESPQWINEPVVRHQDLSTVINNVDGFDYWTTLQLRVPPAALGTADITMTGAAPLPTVGAITVAVTSA